MIGEGPTNQINPVLPGNYNHCPTQDDVLALCWMKSDPRRFLSGSSRGSLRINTIEGDMQLGGSRDSKEPEDDDTAGRSSDGPGSNVLQERPTEAHEELFLPSGQAAPAPRVPSIPKGGMPNTSRGFLHGGIVVREMLWRAMRGHDRPWGGAGARIGAEASAD